MRTTTRGFQHLTLTSELHAGARIHRKGLAGADKAAAEGDVRGDPIDLSAGFEVDEFDIGRKWVTDGVATVTNTLHTNGSVCMAIRHRHDFAHTELFASRKRWVTPGG